MRQTQADGISDSRCPQDDPGPVLPNKSPAALSSRGRRSCVDGNQKRHHGFRKIGERHIPAQAIIEFRFSIIMNSTSDLSYPTLLGEEIFFKENSYVSNFEVVLCNGVDLAGDAEARCPRTDALTGLPSLHRMRGLPFVQASVFAEMPRANATVEKVPRERHMPKKTPAALERDEEKWEPVFRSSSRSKL